MLEQLDSWLLGKHQALIDWSERLPSWWIEQCAFLLFVASITRFVIRDEIHGFHYFVLFMDLVCAFCAFIASRNESVKHSINDDNLRKFMLALGILFIPFWAFQPFSTTFIETIYQIAVIGVCFFAACKPPAPKIRKHEFSYGV